MANPLFKSALDALRPSPPLLAAACLALAGCAAGPDFKTPAAPAVADIGAHTIQSTVATPGVVAGETQRFDRGADVAGDWWTLFQSEPLNALVEQALTNNHDLKASQAALAVARENALAQRGAYLPAVSAGFSANRQRQSGALAPTPSSNAFEYSLYTPQVSVSYAPDIFGLVRRTHESARAQEQAARFQMIATHITLANNVVAAAIQLGALQAQVDATRQLIDIDTRSLEILRYQFAKGYASRLDVAAQETQLAQLAAALPPLAKQLAQQRDLVAALTGRYPSQGADATFDLASLQLPTALPVSLPSALVAQRPDVRQAEANMHAASAQIGVAVANRLPNIALTGNAGSMGLAMNQLFQSGSGFWAIGANLTAPVFEGGTLLHQERGARAAYVQASEQYRSTVITAFQNVADTLAALEQDAEGLKAAAAAEQAARLSLEIAQRQQKDGYGSYLSLLSAEQAYQQAKIGLVQAQASRYADTAALFQALGGGWWRRADLAQGKYDR